MATLDNKSVRGSISGVVKYNNNPDKNLPPDGLAKAAAYIRGDHSVERLYSRGHNGCSSNPDLAIQQFRACERMYRQKKGSSKEAGLGQYEMTLEDYCEKFKVPAEEVILNENGKVWVDKEPIVAEHLFISWPEDELVPYETQSEIADKLCASERLRDFLGLSNSHWNTDNDHFHLLLCNTSKDGSKKLGLNNKVRNELRKELDRICALEYGLSVIDDPGLRWKDPCREEFIRQLVYEGQVNVYVPHDYKKQLDPARPYDRWMLQMVAEGRVLVAKGQSKNRECTQAEAYERWIAEQEYFIREKDKRATKEKKSVVIHESNLEKPKSVRMYYWSYDYPSSKHQGYYYAVRRYDDHGRHKPMLVLLIELLYLVAHNEEQYYKEKYPNYSVDRISRTLGAKTDWALQNMYDCMRYQQQHSVRTDYELQERLKGVGSDLAEARKGIAYYKKTVENGEDLRKAIEAFRTLEPRRVDKTITDEEHMVWTEAYRIMCAHKCTMPVHIDEFYERRRFAEKKVQDLEGQMKQLKKDYHDLKFIESHMHDAEIRIRDYVWQNADSHSVSALIDNATSRGVPSQGGFSREEKAL